MFRFRQDFIKAVVFGFFLVAGAQVVTAQNGFYQLAVLKYRGGGDWYANPTAVPNLRAFCNDELAIGLGEEVATVEVGSPDLFDYPWIHMTGHGNVVFSASEAQNLRSYLEAGGFLHISDNYGMDPFVRREMAKVLPDADWLEVLTHPVFHAAYDLNEGLPMFMSTMTFRHRGLACSTTAGSLCFTTTNPTSATLGRLPGAP